MPFNNANWVSFHGCESPYVRKIITVTNPKEATLNVCGLGFFEAYVNGVRVSQDLLTPVWSDYEKRDLSKLLYPLNDTFTHRTYYLTYDITSMLNDGENCLSFILGNGWYNQDQRSAEGVLIYGKPKLIFSLSLTDDNGTTEINSDDTLKHTQSPIEFNNIYYGYRYNATKEIIGWDKPSFDDSTWQTVEIIDKADTIFTKQECPSDKEIMSFDPQIITQNSKTTVFDCGENLTGWARVTTHAPKGTKITITYAENINEDFSLNYKSAGSDKQIQKDEYICNGSKQIFEPKFTYHGFRFFEITNNFDDIEAVVVNSDVPITSFFTCSDETLDWLYNSYINTQLCNMHTGVPSDCPHRERLGYTGDGQLTASSAMLLLDSRTFYDKWMQDIADCQDINNGHIQHTTPFYGGGGGPGGWGCAIVVVPYNYYKYYNDKTPLVRYYDNMIAWLGYMENHCENGLVTTEEDGGWCLGDWCTPDKVVIPEPFVNTYYYIKCMHIVTEIASLIGQKIDLTNQINTATTAFIDAYYDTKTHSFFGGVQGADAFAIDLELGDDTTLSNLISKYTDECSFDTGIFGTDVLIDVLFKKNQAQLAVDLLTNKTRNSFFNMICHDATTIWEDWHGGASHNHPMFGAVTRQLFHYLLGVNYIHTDDEEKIVISPVLVKSLSQVSGQLVLGGVPISVAVDGNSVTVVHASNGIPVEFVCNDVVHVVPVGEHKFTM